MAVSLGKRKRSRSGKGDQSSSEDDVDAQALFQRAFEAKFKPLERPKPVEIEPEEVGEDEQDAEVSDWSGLSDDEGLVEVVDHDISQSNGPGIDKHRAKTFMSSKPPEADGNPEALPKRREVASEEDPVESAHLKNDLALQRLLKESHLLDPNAFKGKASTPEGKGRFKALDLRLKDLGAKQSITRQEKMPLSHRRGIVSKAASREDKRRKEAAENGVILEKAKLLTTRTEKRRERGMGGPAFGKFRGGTLKLSSRDVRSIQGPARDGPKGRKSQR